MKKTNYRTAWKVVLLGTIVLSLPAASMALPRQGTGVHSCTCTCFVQLGSGQFSLPQVTFKLSNQFACLSANDATCNVTDPVTGGVRQGALTQCKDGGALRVTVPPSSLPSKTNPVPPVINR